MKNFWEGRSVFVTGATGLLGGALVEELVSKNANVVALIRDKNHKSRFFLEELDKKVTNVYGELEDPYALNRILNEYEVNAVFHIGAQTIVGTANRSPISTFETNIRGTWNLMEACRQNPLVERIVFASSDKAYGTQKKLPYDENTPLQGEHPYDVSKSCADLICQSYFKTYGLPVGITRCANLYGPGDLNFNRLIPGTICSILKGDAPVIRSDGKYLRDYMYVKDAVEAYLLLAENIQRPEIKGQAFNFSTEGKTSVIQVVDAILSKMNSKLRPQILNEAKGEIKDQYLSSEKAKTLLNWKSNYPLDLGLEPTINWYSNYFK